MLKARHFVEVDIGCNEFERAAELERLTKLFAGINGLSTDAKNRLVGEFIEILADQNERVICRVQAASVLAMQAKELGLVGAIGAGMQIAQIIEGEFLTSESFGARGQIDEQRLGRWQKVDEMEVMLFQNAMLAVFAADPARGKELSETVIRTSGNAEIVEWVRNFLKKRLANS